MSNKTCEVCGKPLCGRQTRFCSKACAIKGNTSDRKNKPERWAAHRERAAKWQQGHRELAESYKKREARECSWCGAEFEPRADTVSALCAVCAPLKGREGACSEWRSACACCGVEIVQHSPYPRSTCSDLCRYIATRGSLSCAVPWRTCPDCGEVRIDRMLNGGTIRCASCSAKYQATTKHWKIGSRRRARIYERDGWTCQICGGAVDPSLHYLDNFAASLDHIVPRSRGGRHTDDNLRLAHRWCNSVRGDLSYYTDEALRAC